MEISNDADSSSSSSYTSSSYPNLHVTSSYGRNDLIDKDFSLIFMGGKNDFGVRASCSGGVGRSDVLLGGSGSNGVLRECESKADGYDKNVDFYLAFHKNEELIDHYGNTPLYWAAHYGNKEAVRRLVEGYKFPINWQNYSGETALSAAIKESHIDIVQYLIEHGANPNIANASQETPLHIAACMGETVICELLLKYGAYVDLEDEYGETALHWAVREESMEVIDLLVRYGADPHHMSEDNESPEMLAFIIGRSDIFDSIVKLGNESCESNDCGKEDYDMMDIEEYDNFTDSEENSATIIPSSIDEKSHAYIVGMMDSMNTV
eukprot:TRINITY_DN12064_c0_g1_i1.p1 TRINITY_DN12064_c0_g1~~TRINITY_DN12064_c0_g1_i1.p1  ORF type:complete len:322 (-),score=65.79 TRINITY_DN12064_c0_g1_i1:56-1021(-)